MAGEVGAVQRRAGRWRGPLVALGILILLLPLAELAARALAAARGEPWDGEAARARIAERLAGIAAGDSAADPGAADDVLAGEDVLHPFTGYDSRQALEKLPEVAELLVAPGRSEEFVVFLCGGSLAALFDSARTGATGLLAEGLEARPELEGRRVRFVILARGGFKQPQQLYEVQNLFQLGLLPDAVLLLDGFNDVAIAQQNAALGVHPLYPSVVHWYGLTGRGRNDRELLDLALDVRLAERELALCAEDAGNSWTLSSALVGPRALARVDAAHAHWVAAQDAWLAARAQGAGESEDPTRGPRFDADPAAVAGLAAAAWSEASRLLDAACARHGVAYLHVLQPTLHDAGAKIVSDEEARVGQITDEWRTGVELGYPLLRSRLGELAAEGVAVLDASRLFAGMEETLYVDGCHLNRRANRLLAAAIAPALAAAAASR